MDGVFLGSKRTYEDFKKQIPNEIFALFDSLRQHCLSLGDNIIEDVRAHRIVFGKSLSFRWFADLEPQGNSIIIKIQKSRKEPPHTITIQNGQITDELKKTITEAYNTIR
jgi:predicted transport protein